MCAMKPTSLTSAAMSCTKYATATPVLPEAAGNQIATPDRRKKPALATIVQKYSFWPPLKKSTYSGSATSAFETYSLMRRIHRLSSDVHAIGCNQFSIWKKNE